MTESSEFHRELAVATELARAAGAVLMQHYATPFRVEEKINALNEAEVVTEADRAANELIVSRLQAEFSTDGILAEESTDNDERLTKDRVWLIDPMDGTKHFVARDDDFAVQIGLAVGGQCVMGVVYQPARGILHRAERGAGAWVEENGTPARRLQVSDLSDPHEMVLASSQTHRGPRMTEVVDAFRFKNELRRGSVGVKIGLIADRLADLYIHLSPSTKQWDTCAPEIILHEAGGCLTDLFGQPLSYNARRIDNRNGVVATNGVAHQIVIEKLAPLLAKFERAPTAE